MMRSTLSCGLVAAALLALPAGGRAQRPAVLTVAAAASLGGVAAPLARAFHDASGLDLRFTFGGSNTLARQIVEGARIDVFISADAAQMDVVQQADRVLPGSRVDVLRNQLVIIVPEASAAAVDGADDLGGPAVARVAMGDPAAVPAGVYGRQWLEGLGLWTAVSPKVVPLQSSPAALAAVRAGRAEAGIVYATDAHKQAGVRVAVVVPAGEGPRIVYPAAALRGGREEDARSFVRFLTSPAASRIFTASGFLLASPAKG